MNNGKRLTQSHRTITGIINNPKFLIFLTILFWSFCIILTRLISIRTPFLNLNIQFFFVFIFFLIYNLIYYKKNFIYKLLHVKLAYFLFGIFGYFIYYFGLIESFKYFNSASITAILNYTFPIFTVVFRDILLVTPSPKTFRIAFLEYSGLSLGLLSIIIIATQGHIGSFQFINFPGLLWGLIAGISYGVFSAYSSNVNHEEQPIFLLAGTFSSWIISIFLSIPELSNIKTLTFSDYFFQAVLAFVVNGLGYITWARANWLANIQHLSISSLASLMYILPFLSITIISLFLQETNILKGYFLFGLVLLILGTYICQKSESIYDFFS